MSLQIELATLLDKLVDESDYWQVTMAREDYREQVRFGFDGAEKRYDQCTLLDILDGFITKFDSGIQKAEC